MIVIGLSPAWTAARAISFSIDVIGRGEAGSVAVGGDTGGGGGGEGGACGLAAAGLSRSSSAGRSVLRSIKSIASASVEQM